MTHTGTPASEQHAPSSISEIVQVVGVIFSVIVAFITGGSTFERLAIGLAIGASVLMTGTLWMRLSSDWRRRGKRIVSQGLVSVVLVVLALFSWSHKPSSAAGGAGNPPSASPSEPKPFIEQSGYTLEPSSSLLTNDRDKIDIDTGCPGWGDMHPRVGPSRCGDLADLVADQDSIHTADGKPNIFNLAPGAPAVYRMCRAITRQRPLQGTNKIDSGALAQSEDFCVLTDQGNIAVVHIDSIKMDGTGQLAAIKIDFKAWHTR